jgi:membrane protein implicated in regulation of membrane protease activity
MKPLHIAVVGAIILVVPFILGLLEMIWLPLGIMLLIIGVVLHLVQKYYSRRLDKATQRE